MPCSPLNLAKRVSVKALLALALAYGAAVQVNRGTAGHAVVAAYKRLELKVRPDKGGTNEDFQKMQAAKPTQHHQSLRPWTWWSIRVLTQTAKLPLDKYTERMRQHLCWEATLKFTLWCDKSSCEKLPTKMAKFCAGRQHSNSRLWCDKSSCERSCNNSWPSENPSSPLDSSR